MSDRVKIVYPVRDLAKAKPLYRALLGVEPVMDEPYYVGFDLDGQHVGLDPHGHDKGMTGAVCYWRVDDIKSSLQALLDGDAKSVQEITDVGGGAMIAAVKDADGNVVGLIQSA